MNRDKNIKKGLLTDFLREYEKFSFGKTDLKTYADANLRTAEKLVELCPEEPVYHLMVASVLISKGKKEDAEKILKKYERNHILHFRNPEFRACFLYLAGMLTEDKLQRKNILIQLQKLYQKNPAQPSLYWYLARLDEGFEKNPEKKLAFLEKQWRLGCKQNLLYMEVILTLRANPEAAGDMGDFLMQSYIWAQRRNVINKEMGAQIAKHGMKLRQSGQRYEYLLRECYRIFSTKELLSALCSLYIRAGRTDRMAASYYAKGVEFQLSLNNLYEYYMMSTTEQKEGLLPEQVLLYFLYHDTLSSVQKAYLYKNIVCYGDKKSEIYQKFIGKIEKYTVESLLQRKLSPEYAYLYENILHPEIFTKEMAEAMADLMFLRKLNCTDGKIKAVRVEYPQLNKEQTILLKRQQAYVPVYSPAAMITLVDDKGNLYRNTVSYQMEKLFNEKNYMDVCRKYVKNHAGLLLHLCAKNASKVLITEENMDYYGQVPETKEFSQEYRNTILIRLTEYASIKKEVQELPETWFQTDGATMTREQRGKMITCLVQRKEYEEAYRWLESYGTVHVSANAILKVLTAVSEEEKSDSELYYRLCYGCFQNGQVNYTVLKYLSKTFLGTCEQMRMLWKQAKAFGVETGELEERILVQMMFTGTELLQHFEIFLSYNQRTPKDYVKKAYLTYFARESFVKNHPQDNRFYFLLEDALFSGELSTDLCKLAYLKYLSEAEYLSTKQKQTVAVYLKEFFAKKCYYGFMKKFGSVITQAKVLEDKLFVEYYAPASSKVMLQYEITRRDAAKEGTLTCKLYPTYEGVYSKAVTLFEGDRLTWAITEQTEGGQEKTTEPVTVVMSLEPDVTSTKYRKINHLRRLSAGGKKNVFVKELSEYRCMEMLTEQLFDMK